MRDFSERDLTYFRRPILALSFVLHLILINQSLKCQDASYVKK